MVRALSGLNWLTVLVYDTFFLREAFCERTHFVAAADVGV